MALALNTHKPFFTQLQVKPTNFFNSSHVREEPRKSGNTIFPIICLRRYILDTQGQLTLLVVCGLIWPTFELVQDILCMSLLSASLKKDRININ